MAKYVTIRTTEEVLQALQDAVEALRDDEEGAVAAIIVAAEALTSAKIEPVFTIDSERETLTHKVAVGKRVGLWKPRALPGEVVVPVHLSWLKTSNIGEARGKPDAARLMAAALLEAADEAEVSRD